MHVDVHVSHLGRRNAVSQVYHAMSGTDGTLARRSVLAMYHSVVQVILGPFCRSRPSGCVRRVNGCKFSFVHK